MASSKPVKWSVKSEEPEDLQEFKSNDEILDEAGWPTKGTILKAKVRNIYIGEIKTGDNAGKSRLRPMLVVSEPKGSPKAKWNGLAVFGGLNVTDQGTAYVKAFLKTLGLSWKDFIEKSRQDKSDPPNLVQIGRVKISDEPELRFVVKIKDDDYGMSVEPARYLPLKNEDPDEDEDEDDDDTEDEDVEVMEEEEEEEEEEEVEEEEDEDEEEQEEEEDDTEDELREELSSLKVAALGKRATRLALKSKMDVDELPTKKDKLIDFIVEMELNNPPF